MSQKTISYMNRKEPIAIEKKEEQRIGDSRQESGGHRTEAVGFQKVSSLSLWLTKLPVYGSSKQWLLILFSRNLLFGWLNLVIMHQ